jgi:hypothetical protein
VRHRTSLPRCGFVRGVKGEAAGELTPIKSQPPYDEERLATLKAIRARFIDLAQAGDESAARIVRAVDSMIAEVENWLRPAGGVRRGQP